MTFENWWKIANNYCIAKIGIGINDLPDVIDPWDYYDESLNYEDQVHNAEEYVKDIVSHEGFEELAAIM